MILTKKQRQIAGNMLMYVVISELIEENECDTEAEQEVLTELIEGIELKIGKFDMIPTNSLAEIIEFVKGGC